MNQIIRKMKVMKINYKNILLFSCLLYFTLYIPFFFVAYSTNWYEFNYSEKIKENVIIQESTSNIVNYFFHKEELNKYWSENEKIHLQEVRNIYDSMFIIFILSFILIWLFWDKEFLRKYSLVNVGVISCLLLILPFFVFFWDRVFHPILFDNTYWIIEKQSLFYYMFAYSFFSNSLIFIVCISILINILFWFSLKREKL